MAFLKSKVVLSIGLAAIGSAIAGALPGHTLTFNLGGAQATDSTSLTFTDTTSTVNLEFSGPAGNNNPVVQRNVNGVCSYMTFGSQLQTPVPFCGQNTNNTSISTLPPVNTLPANQTLETIQFKFDKNVILKSFTVAAISFEEPGAYVSAPDRQGQVGNGTVTFAPRFTNSDSGTFTSPHIVIDTTPNATAGDPLATANFLNSNPQSPCVATSGSPAGSRCTIPFSNNYFVRSGTLVTISTPTFSATSNTFSESLSDPGGHWRLFALEADEVVPGPLPLLGAGAAFGWSRRMRQRITMNTTKNPIHS